MFREALTESIDPEITLDKFISRVNGYGSLELALSELPSEYLEFWSNNERYLRKSLKKLKLVEEFDNFLGYAPEKTLRKKIKYRGEVIILEWDKEMSVWLPIVAKRSIVQAVKYAKRLVDQDQEQDKF